jgi:hypothetical protein
MNASFRDSERTGAEVAAAVQADTKMNVQPASGVHDRETVSSARERPRGSCPLDRGRIATRCPTPTTAL